MIHLLLLSGFFAQDAAPPQSRDELIKAEIEKAVKDLEDPDRADYRAARASLIELSHAAAPSVLKVLRESKSAQARHLACDILGSIRESTAVEELRKHLIDHELFGTSVASKAAQALGMIGDAAAILDLCKALAESGADANLKYEAINALGLLRAIDAAPEIRKAVADKAKTDYGAPISGVAIQSLMRLKVKDAADDIALALDDATVDEWNVRYGGWKVRHIAALALQELTGEKNGELAGNEQVRDKTADAWVDWRDNRKKIATTKERIAALAGVVDAYVKDKGALPETIAKLRDEKPAGSDKPYLGPEISSEDGWGHPIVYRPKGWGAPYDLYSLGSDFEIGGSGSKADLFNHGLWIKYGQDETNRRMKDVVAALAKFKEDQGSLPTNLPDLKTRPSYVEDKKWPKDGYCQELNDAWGRGLIYIPPQGDTPYVLKSLGYDGKPGGEGPDSDVTSNGLQ